MTDISFGAYTRNMYQEAMSERRSHGEEMITYEEYVVVNLDFLYDKFEFMMAQDD